MSLLKDGTHGTHKDYPSGPLLLSAKNIKNGRVYYDETDRRISYKDFEKIHRNFKLQIGDILLTIVGSIGETALLKDSFEITFQRSVAFLRAKDNILPEFLMSEFNTGRFRNELEDRKSTSAQPGIYLGDLGEIPVFVSKNTAEQRRVGSYFESLDHLITLHQSKSFGHILKVIAGYTLYWEQRKLGEICQITMGQSPDGSTYSEISSDYILVQGNADLKDGWVYPRIWTTQKTKTANAGDLIMSVRAPAGTMGKTSYDVVLGRGVAGIKGSEFIYQLLVKMDLDDYWKKLAMGSTFESINSDVVNGAELMVTENIDEQNRIGDYFDSLDHLITLHQLEPFQLIFKAIAYRIIDYAKSKPPRCRKYTGLILFIKYYI